MAVDEYLLNVARNAGRSSLDQNLAETFYGLNITGRNAAIPNNTENHGYTFFTRPMMNMTYDNLIVDRVLSTLLLERSESVQRIIRTYLDPSILNLENLSCPYVDNHLPFIPLLSNNLISLSGWPDFTLNTFSSSPGLYREVYSYVDDVPYNYEAYNLTASFRNLQGDPITFLLLMWGWYQGLVYEGRIMPYPENVISNKIDYMTRIYRLVMDSTRTYVTRIGATGVAYPMTAPTGNIFNFEGDGSESPFSTTNDQITVNFQCLGFTYYDYILIYEFNWVVGKFKPQMRTLQSRLDSMVKLAPFEKEYFNRRSYPYLNEITMELEWWVDKPTYEAGDPSNNLIRA